jgi:hypothetical protein
MASVGESRMDAEAIHLEIAKGQCMKSSQCPLGGFPVELVIKIARAVEFAKDDENESEGFSTPPASPAFDRPCPVRPVARACAQRHPGHTVCPRSEISLLWDANTKGGRNAACQNLQRGFGGLRIQRAPARPPALPQT